MFGLLVLTLGPLVASLFVLSGFILFRVGIFGLVRLDIFDYCVHELTHVLDSSLEPAELVHQRLKLTIPFQDNYCSLGYNCVSGVHYI